jgi:hypothetical protein
MGLGGVRELERPRHPSMQLPARHQPGELGQRGRIGLHQRRLDSQLRPGRDVRHPPREERHATGAHRTRRRRANRDRVEHRVDRIERREVSRARQHLGRAEPGDPILVVVGGEGEHSQPVSDGELGGEAADRAAGPGDEQRRTRRRADEVKRLARSQRVQRDRRRGDLVEAQRPRREPARFDRRCLRVGADPAAGPDPGDHPDDAIAGRVAGRLGAKLGDRPREVPARDEARLQIG